MISIVEKKHGDFDCPVLVLTEKEEQRLYKPWKQGVIVKLLGHRIGFKVLESRHKQMWVRKGVIQIVDLGNDFFLVTFSNEDDHQFALTEGPWLIFYHYLTVREWCPNFHLSEATLEKVVVWVRLSGLPIEYYDEKVLKALGNRIGKTVKVDKTTLKQERGKYACMSVEVDLLKPLLPFFEIKGRCYNIEYEGLHLLCLSCGKFGHYLDGCPDKEALAKGAEPSEGHTKKHKEGCSSAAGQQGPWVVVQKPRRPRKGAPFGPKVSQQRVEPNGSGSRFNILHKEAGDGDQNGGGMEDLSRVVVVHQPLVDKE